MLSLAFSITPGTTPVLISSLAAVSQSAGSAWRLSADDSRKSQDVLSKAKLNHLFFEHTSSSLA